MLLFPMVNLPWCTSPARTPHMMCSRKIANWNRLLSFIQFHKDKNATMSQVENWHIYVFPTPSVRNVAIKLKWLGKEANLKTLKQFYTANTRWRLIYKKQTLKTINRKHLHKRSIQNVKWFVQMSLLTLSWKAIMVNTWLNCKQYLSQHEQRKSNQILMDGLGKVIP